MHVTDLQFSAGMVVLGVSVTCLYLGRLFLHGRARHDRVNKDGGSVFLAKPTMEMAYWMIQPLVGGLSALGITANAVTAFSLVPMLFAALAAGLGWFGLACVLATLGAFCDLLDGLLARRQGAASNAGEVLDAAVDRYGELLLLAGVGIYYRTHWMMLVLVFAALGGSFMFSYSTAKAEAMDVAPPRGSMRRAERAVYLLFGLGLTPITRYFFADLPSHALRELPIIVALSLVAVVTNVSTIQRFAAVGRTLRARDALPPADPIAAEPESTGRP